MCEMSEIHFISYPFIFLIEKNDVGFKIETLFSSIGFPSLS